MQLVFFLKTQFRKCSNDIDGRFLETSLFIKDNDMKKKAFSLLVPCVSLILSGCGGGSNDSNQSTENPPKNVNRAPIAVNDTVTTFQVIRMVMS